MFGYEKSSICQKSKSFYLEIRIIIKKYKYDYVLKDQLSRSSLSVLLNVVEGTGRFTKKEQRRFMVIARSSLFETMILLELLRDENFLNPTKYDDLYKEGEEISKILYTMILNYERNISNRV